MIDGPAARRRGVVAYRIGQALGMWRARMSARERAEALDALPSNLRPVFLRMTDRDQHHSLMVLRGLRAEGHASPAMEQAALLHDVGKAEAPMGVPGRSLVVLAQAIHLEGVLRALPWLGGRVRRYQDHPAIGAAILEKAGADATVVDIVARHQEDPPPSPETLMLRAVDRVK